MKVIEDYLVSIIIPAYNVENYVNRALESAINQTYKKIEIIVVNDGSTDATGEIARRYATRDNRIRVLDQCNQGVSAARNHGMDKSKGDYLLFLDSDDWLEDNTVEELLNALDNKDMLICADCYYASIDKKGSIVKEQQGAGNNERLVSRNELLNLVGTTNQFRTLSSCYKLFSRGILQKASLNFCTDISYGEDALFTFMYLCNVDSAKYIPLPLWNILDRPGSATNSSYSPKWKSAIKSVDRMLSYPLNDSNEVKNKLKILKAERAKWAELACLRSPIKYKDDFIFLQRSLRQNKKYLLKVEKNIKQKVHIIILSYLPFLLLRLLIK